MTAKPTYEIIDAHHHFVDPERIDYHFVEFLPELRRFLGTDELEPLIREAGVARTVVVQAHDGEDETAFMLEQAARVDWVAGVVGWVPLLAPERTAKAIETHTAGKTLLRGVRHLIHDEVDDDWLLQDPVIESLKLLAAAGLSFDLSAFKPRHIEHAITLGAQVPDLEVVICHMGMPRLMDDPMEWEPWASTFAGAASNPRCSVKISGLDMYIGGPSTAKTQRYINHALDHFGAERMIWASNWPVSLRGEGYRELLDVAREVTRRCSEDECTAIFGGNARRVYRLADPAD